MYRLGTFLARSIIIVTSGKAATVGPRALDEMIRLVVRQRKQPILVLGPDGDEFLRACEEIESCEIIFDPNYDGGLFSGVKAGLHATTSAAFVVALGEPIHEEAFPLLAKELWQIGHDDSKRQLDCDIICPLTQIDGREIPVFPVLVTGLGTEDLKELAATTAWTSETIRRSFVRLPRSTRDTDTEIHN